MKQIARGVLGWDFYDGPTIDGKPLRKLLGEMYHGSASPVIALSIETPTEQKSSDNK